MSIDNSLKIKRGLLSTRNVLTRAERLVRLKKERRWQEGDSVLGLPKVRTAGKPKSKKKKKKEEAEATTEGEASPAEE